ncbi:glutamate-rich protein 2 isoform X6 [Natator depressus]|uniref:glutamate-rich protein 2 isoform X6 n=1 Tax=Natator depressus TaxID=27790 RepID=UPI003EC0CC9D
MNRCDVVWAPGTPRTTTPKVSGMLEVIGPDDGFILEACLTMSRTKRMDKMADYMCLVQKKWLLNQFKQCHVCIEEQGNVLNMDGALISMDVDQNLQTEFIRQQNKSHYVQLNQLLKNPTCRWDSSAKSIKNKNSSRIQETNLRSPHYIQETTDDKEKNSRNVEKPANNELSTEFQTNSIDDHNIDEQLSEATDDDESSSENEDRKRNAPIELLGEFLKAIMDQDYSLSKKLCQMILIYEPENTEAKQFLPLLEEKLLIESTQNFGDEEGEETDEGSSEDSEEDTSSSDSSDDEGEGSSDDSDENV